MAHLFSIAMLVYQRVSMVLTININQNMQWNVMGKYHWLTSCFCTFRHLGCGASPSPHVLHLKLEVLGWSSKFPSTPISIYRYYIHYISIIYLLYIYYISIIYLLYIYYISIIYLLYIYLLYIYYIYIHYISIIYTLYIYYIYIIYLLYIHYISIIYTLYIHYI